MSQSYAFMVEVNDLTQNVIWDDIPDINVPASAVTQHVAVIDHDALLNYAANVHFTQAAISITRSQVNDMPQATTTELEDMTDAINTDASKELGLMVLNTTTGLTVFAAGNGDTDIWEFYNESLAHTPV